MFGETSWNMLGKEQGRKDTKENDKNTRKSNVDLFNYEKNTKCSRIFLSRHEGLSIRSILSSAETVREMSLDTS